MAPKYWLMKAEPDSRVVKGKDVKFSVDDFESVKTTQWEGVRNHEAKNLMKEMKIGDKVLFYHSNCKIPGIAGFAEVSKEAYPDYTAWDTTHPYHDAKTKQDDPRWFMVDVTFTSRATHFVPLALLKHIAGGSFSEPPAELQYMDEDGIKAVRGMALVRKARLSVQRVDERTWGIIKMLAEKGGWDEMNFGKKANSADTGKLNKSEKGGKAKARKNIREEEEEVTEEDAKFESAGAARKSTTARRKQSQTSEGNLKRKAKEQDGVNTGTQRSTRAKK